MIRFRQKNFVGWMIPTMIGTTGLSFWQTHQQGKEQEKQAEETKAALDRQTKALNKIAKEAKNNPELAQQVVAQKQMSSEGKERVRLFAAIPPGTIKNVTGFAKDIWKTQKGNLRRAAKTSLSFGAMGYAGNRIATSLKDHDEGNDKKNTSFLKKAGAVGAGVGTAYLLARKGKLGTTPIKALNGKTGSQVVQGGIEKAGKIMNPIQRSKDGTIDKLGTGLNTFFIGSPVLGYLGQRGQTRDQIKQTERAYSEEEGKTRKKLLKVGAGILGTAGTIAAARRGVLGGHAQRFTGNLIANTGGIMRSAGLKGAGEKVARSGSKTYALGLAKKKPISEQAMKVMENRKFKQVTTPARISSGVNQAATFFGFYGKGGTKAVQNTANTLAASENKLSQRVGKFMQDHKTAANLMAGGGSLAVGTTIMGAGSTPFKAFDKHAYDYEEQQNQQVS